MMYVINSRLWLMPDLFHPALFYHADDRYISKTLLSRDAKRAMRWCNNVLAKKQMVERKRELHRILDGGNK